jgi:hypothetical protein
MIHTGRYLNDNELCYLGTIKVMADVYLKSNTGHTSGRIDQNLKLSTMVLITSRPVTQNKHPKRSIVKAKFIEPKSYE